MTAQKTIWSVGGGKGGVGKSVTTTNLGAALAMRGKEVILVDADLGGANLHTYFGLKYPQKSLDDFIKGRCKTLEETSVETPVKGLRLITGGGEFLGIADPEYAQKQNFIEQIRKLDAEYIIVDLGAGSTNNVLDFFGISAEGIVVLAPEPAAIQNAYMFVKSFVYRRFQRLFADNRKVSDIITESTDARSDKRIKTVSDLCERIASLDRGAAVKAVSEVKAFRPKLLLNMAASKEDVKVAEAFKNAASAFLSLDTDFIGVLYSRPSIKAAARRMRPFMLDESAVEARRDMDEIVTTLLAASGAAATPPAGAEAAREVFGFNDNVEQNGTVFHVQTEAQGGNDPVVETIIYQSGRVFFSKRSTIADIRRDAKTDLREFARKQHYAAITAVKMNRITAQGLK